MLKNIVFIIKDIYIKLGITRYKRIQNYIKELEKNVIISSNFEKNEISLINKLILDKIKFIKRANKINFVFYFGIYFSFFSIFFSNYFFLSEIADLIARIIGFFGTTIFVIGIFFINKFIDLYYQDLNLLASHIISIYQKSAKSKIKIFEPENNYSIFIDFFKKRGF